MIRTIAPWTLMPGVACVTSISQVFPERAMLMDKIEGFVSNQILGPVNEGDPYVMYLVQIS